MAKRIAAMVRMVLTVAATDVADIMERLADVADTITIERGDGERMIAETPDPDDDDVDDVPASTRRPDVRRLTAVPRGEQRADRRPSTRLAGKVIYTPNGTARQLTKMLDELRGQKTMKALVLRDLIRHPGSSNKEIRERIAPKAKEYGISVESVDNVVWKFTKGRNPVVSKSAEAE